MGEALELASGEHVLAVVRYGHHEAAGDVGEAVVVDVPLPQLGPEPLLEVWTTGDEAVAPEDGALAWTEAGDLAFGALTFDASEVELGAGHAYDRLLARLAESEHPHLLRMWNVVPRINEAVGESDADGVSFDRYMAFCRARSLAFERHHGPRFARGLSAASAVGAADGPGVVYFLSCRREGERLENPRQLEAWRYPPRYGPRSPSFARATRPPAPFHREVLVSGTASIVGAESVHAGDTRAQVVETLRNLTAVAEAASLPAGAGRWLLKAYVRHPEEVEVVREQVVAAFGASTPLLFLRADICRADLSVEIEGVVR